MTEWVQVTLSEVSEKPQYGAIASGSDDPAAGPLFVRQTDIDDGFIRWATVPYCDLEPDQYDKYALMSDDILVARLGSVGRAVRVRDTHDAIFAGYLVRFRVADPSRVDPRFLEYQVRSPAWWQHVDAVRSGAVQPTLNAKQMGAFEFALPPLEVQRGIGATLGSLDDQIESNTHTISILESLGAALLEVRLELDVYGFPRYDETPLGDRLAVVETGSRPKGGVSGIKSGVPSLGAENVQSAGVVASRRFKFVPLDFAASMKRGKLSHGDVLVYKDGGKPGNFEPHISAYGYGFPAEDATINEHVYRVRAASGVSQGLLYWILRSPWMDAEMRRRGTGVAIPGLNQTNFKGLPYPTLASEDAHELNDLLEPMLDAMLQLGKENQRLIALRDALMPELLSGRISMPEAQEAVV